MCEYLALSKSRWLIVQYFLASKVALAISILDYELSGIQTVPVIGTII